MILFLRNALSKTKSHPIKHLLMCVCFAEIYIISTSASGGTTCPSSKRGTSWYPAGKKRRACSTELPVFVICPVHRIQKHVMKVSSYIVVQSNYDPSCTRSSGLKGGRFLAVGSTDEPWMIRSLQSAITFPISSSVEEAGAGCQMTSVHNHLETCPKHGLCGLHSMRIGAELLGQPWPVVGWTSGRPFHRGSFERCMARQPAT